MPFAVTVSGTTLRFPQTCACCGGPADATFNVQDRNVSTTQSAAKTTKTTTIVTWPIPACTTCLPHNPSDDMKMNNPWDAGYQAGPARSKINLERIQDPKGKIVLGILCGFLLGFFGWMLFAVGQPGRAVGDARHKVAVLAAIGFGGLGFGLVYGLARLKFNREMKEAIENNAIVEKEEQRYAAEEAKRDATRGPQCCKPDQRAAYFLDRTPDGNNTFTFQRKDFTEAFENLNREFLKKTKIVRSYLGV